MDKKQKRLHDLNQSADETRYKVLFYTQEYDLYETLHLDSPPVLPEEGDYVSFNFVVDEQENEVFRKDGLIKEKDIGSDEEYTHLSSVDIEISEIKTRYRKHVTTENMNTTTIEKVVIFEPNDFL